MAAELNDIVQVNISVESAGLSRDGFGTPLLMSNEASSVFAETTRIYTDTDGMINDGFSANGVTVGQATAIFSQNPRVASLVVGKRLNLTDQSIKLTPVAVNDTLYRVTINGVDFDYTSDADATVAEITLGLTTAINGGSEPVTATDNTTDLDVDADIAGEVFSLDVDRTLITRKDNSADPGIVADLTNIQTAIDGNDSWYAVLIDSNSQAEIEALAAQILTLEKFFYAQTSDDDVLTSSTTDVGSVLSSLNNFRVLLQYTDKGAQHLDAALAGNVLPTDPGSITQAYRTPVGVATTKFTPTEQANLTSKNVNSFQTRAGADITLSGVTSRGAPFFADIVRGGIDFLSSDIQNRMVSLLFRSNKVPYTDDGIASLEKELRAALDNGIGQGIVALTNDPVTGAQTSPLVNAEPESQQSTSDKENRIYPGFTFSYEAQGAIHQVIPVNGTITF